jgi:outer membrane protein
MKPYIRCLACSLALFAGLATAQSLKIGYVNGLRIERESAISKQSIESVKKEFAPREQQLQELQKQGVDLRGELEKGGAKMASAEKQAKEKRLAALGQQFEQMQRSYAEDLEIRQRELQARLISEINVVIKGLAEAGKYDLIVQQAVYGGSQIDITDQVLKEMAKRADEAASAK